MAYMQNPGDKEGGGGSDDPNALTSLSSQLAYYLAQNQPPDSSSGGGGGAPLPSTPTTPNYSYSPLPAGGSSWGSYGNTLGSISSGGASAGITGSLLSSIYSSLPSLIASLIGGYMTSGAAKDAAQIQSDAAKYAVDKTYAAQQQALAFEQAQYENNLKNQQPWIQTGQNAIARLNHLMGMGDVGTGVNTSLGYLGGSGGTGGPITTGTHDGSPAAIVDSKTVPVPTDAPTITIDTGGPGGRFRPMSSVGSTMQAPGGGGFSVRDPTGQIHVFPTQIQASTFAQQAGVA